MKLVALIFIGAFAFMTARAGEKVEGAFGFKFGDSFQPSSPPVMKDVVGGKGFEVKAKVPNPMFSEYLVYITPNSHLIYQIVGLARAVDKPGDNVSHSCHELQEKLGAILERKYGRKPGTAASDYGTDSTGVSLTSVYGAREGCYFGIVYKDAKLEQQATDEGRKTRQQELLRDADATGL